MERLEGDKDLSRSGVNVATIATVLINPKTTTKITQTTECDRTADNFRVVLSKCEADNGDLGHEEEPESGQGDDHLSESTHYTDCDSPLVTKPPTGVGVNGQPEMGNSKTTKTLGLEAPIWGGQSFSDGAAAGDRKRPTSSTGEPAVARRQFEARLRNWTRSNNTIRGRDGVDLEERARLESLEQLLASHQASWWPATATGEAVVVAAAAAAAAAVASTGEVTGECRKQSFSFAGNANQTENEMSLGPNSVCHHHQQQQQQLRQQQRQPNELQQPEPIQSDIITQQQRQPLIQNYASRLSHLYRRNRADMDKNSDFRNLLYNIICCLLRQDDQVLGSQSVSSMVEVIRGHLESAAKFYLEATRELTGGEGVPEVAEQSTANHCKWGQEELRQMLARQPGEWTSGEQRTHWIGSELGDPMCVSADSGTGEQEATGSSQTSHQGDSRWRYEELSSEWPNFASGGPTTATGTATGSSRTSSIDMSQAVAGGSERYFRRRPSQLCGASTGLPVEQLTKRHSADGGLSHFRPKQRPAYLSSEDDDDDDDDEEEENCLERLQDQQMGCNSDNKKKLPGFCSTSGSSCAEFGRDSVINNAEKTLVILDDDDQEQHNDVNDYLRSQSDGAFGSAFLATGRGQQVDVGARRSELEWSLNKLVNLELKLSWLANQETMRRAIRKVGVPNEIRARVWQLLIERHLGSNSANYDIGELLAKADKTLLEYRERRQVRLARNQHSFELADLEPHDGGHSEDLESHLDREAEDERARKREQVELQAILKQIELDVNRTMPGHRLFDEGAEGGLKLRRILVAYSVHVNRAIAYCQGFNFIVALLLSVFEGDQQMALKGFICIVDHIFPSQFYFDHYLTGARADQFLLADFICDQLIRRPTSCERKTIEGVTSSITLNWFISLFHGALPTLSRLTVLDHFLLDGVKALFKFTMAILHLALKTGGGASGCQLFSSIRNTARDLYDVKLLVSIADQIKLPKDSYFAIRRSFYMIQSSLNSDQFFMTSQSSEAARHLMVNKPLSLQTTNRHTQLPHLSRSPHQFGTAASGSTSGHLGSPRRVCLSQDRSKILIQIVGRLGRSHLKIIDASVRSNERSLVSPLRNLLVIGISNCGRQLILARQASRRQFRSFRDQGLQFEVHELTAELFDGFYLEQRRLIILITQTGEVLKINAERCFSDSLAGSTETLALRDSLTSSGELKPTGSGSVTGKLKLRKCSLDPLTSLLWLYAEYEPPPYATSGQSTVPQTSRKFLLVDLTTLDVFSVFELPASFGELLDIKTSLLAYCRLANPMSSQFSSRLVRVGPTGRHEHLLSFSDVVDYLVSVPEPAPGNNSESNKTSDELGTNATSGASYSTSIRRLLARTTSATKRTEQQHQQHQQQDSGESIRLRPEVARRSKSDGQQEQQQQQSLSGGTLTRCYRKLVRAQSTTTNERTGANENRGHHDFRQLEAAHLADQVSSWSRYSVSQERARESDKQQNNRQQDDYRAMLANHICAGQSQLPASSGSPSCSGGSLDNYQPVSLAFVFRNGRIALFEFTQSYAIHTRESQLDRYDYAHIIDIIRTPAATSLVELSVGSDAGGAAIGEDSRRTGSVGLASTPTSRRADDYVVTILNVVDRLIKVVI